MSVRIKQSAWVTIGVVLWGLPTGIMAALFSSLIKSGTILQLQRFDMTIFYQRASVLVPLFVVLGIFLGFMMFHLSERQHSR